MGLAGSVGLEVGPRALVVGSSAPYGAKNFPVGSATFRSDVDQRAIARVAQRQDGLLTVDQVLRSGANLGHIQHQIELRRWQRIHRFVIGINGCPDMPTRSLRAALLIAPDAVASHHSAGALHRFTHLPPGPPTITGPLGSHLVIDGVLVHRTGTLLEHHTMQRSGLRITTPARTAVDLAGDLDDRAFPRMLEDQLAGRRISLDQCVDVIAELPTRGRRGVARARRVVIGLDEQPPPESELEARMIELLARRGAPQPVRQMSLHWSSAEPGRVDFAWPDLRVLVETDGRRYHARMDAFEHDRLRDQFAIAAGWRPVRFTWRQVLHNQRHVGAILRAVLC